MTCVKAQSMITPFIKNQLNVQELEEFLDHIGSCPNCKEELEFYYTLLTAMKQLNEDKNLSNNFRQELAAKIKKAQEKIIHEKYTYFRKKAVLILFMILLAFLLSISYAEKSVEKISNATKSDFRIKNVFRDQQYDEIEQQLQQYLDQQKLTVTPSVNAK